MEDKETHIKVSLHSGAVPAPPLIEQHPGGRQPRLPGDPRPTGAPPPSEGDSTTPKVSSSTLLLQAASRVLSRPGRTNKIKPPW